jgi:hypothetical protein
MYNIFVFVFVFAVLGHELRAFTLSHSARLFVMGISEIWSHELFVQAGFELISS